MRNKLFSLVIILLLILGIGIFVLPQNDISNLENRNLATNSSIEINSLIKSVDNVLKDQFYFRDTLTQNYYKIKTNFNRLFGSNEEYIFLSDGVVDIGDGYLISKLTEYNEETLKSASNRGYNVNEVDNKYPDIKTYVYFPKRLEELINLSGSDDDISKFNENFIIQLNENITYDYLKYETIDEYKNLFFKSDFHWNYKGAYQGYSDIINMINDDYDIGNPKTIIDEITYPYSFEGNVANKIGKNGTPDYIGDYVLDDIGDCDYYVNGVKKEVYESKEHYRDYGPNDGETDYDSYFAGYELKRVYDYHDETKPNILIFGDSFINPIQIWLSSHFNKTVIIDLRNNDGSFNLDEIIEEYDIDMILVCEMYYNLYINGNMFIPLD